MDDPDVQVLGSKEGEGPKGPSMAKILKVRQELFNDIVSKSFDMHKGDASSQAPRGLIGEQALQRFKDSLKK